jgi:hypothetical protein
MEQMPWIRSDKTMRMLIIKLEREGCIISMSGSRNSRRYSLGFDFLKRFGYVVPITPERKEFTDFHDEPYKLRKNDIEYLHSVAEAVIGTLEARKLDVVLLDKAVSIMGKPDVLNAIQGFAFKVTTTEYETLDAASLHECISYELSEYDYDDNRDIYRENVLQPV